MKMKNKLLLLSIMALCLFTCGCNKNDASDSCSDNQCAPVEEKIENEIVEPEFDETEIVVAEKLEWDEQITVSEWDWNSPSVELVEEFETSI